MIKKLALLHNERVYSIAMVPGSRFELPTLGFMRLGLAYPL